MRYSKLLSNKSKKKKEYQNYLQFNNNLKILNKWKIIHSRKAHIPKTKKFHKIAKFVRKNNSMNFNL